jgi:hypothetical protein
MEVLKTLDNTLLSPILRDLDWLSAFINLRIQNYFQKDMDKIVELPSPPEIDERESPYIRFLLNYNLTIEERIVFLMSMVPLLKPQIYDCFFIQNKSIGRSFSEFGGVETKSNGGFNPTVETLNFVINGQDVSKRVTLFKLFSEDHFFAKNQVLFLKRNQDNDTFWSRRLVMNEDFFYHLISGEQIKPKFSAGFPAKELTTPLEIEDLVLNKQLKEELYHILAWMEYRSEISSNQNLSKNFRKGYRALFYGPPGTGKSLTAAMLGKMGKQLVYRVDLSQVVSKYIGETEKNLSRLLDTAEYKNWVLFFDEAEALFSKRTDVNDSKDKYANQGTAYLLQRLEDFDGLVILASNLKPNIDRAFVRRFQSIIYFNVPNFQERLQLWENSLKAFDIDQNLDLSKLAEKYEVSGAAISNAIQFAWLNARRHQRKNIGSFDIEAGLLRELSKEGKSVK